MSEPLDGAPAPGLEPKHEPADDRDEGASSEGPQPAAAGGSPRTASAGRPLIERIGMTAIALVLAALFGGVALAAFSGGEPFLGVMAAVGCLMTLWVGFLTLLRG